VSGGYNAIIRDPHKEEKLAAIKVALDNCNANNPVFCEDEVDINLKPKIDVEWGFRGKQLLVATPGRKENEVSAYRRLGSIILHKN